MARKTLTQFEGIPRRQISHIERFKKGLLYHRKLAEAISEKDVERAEAMSMVPVRMPYSDLAGRLCVKSANRL